MSKPKIKEYSEQEILECIIEAHFNALEHYKKMPEKNAADIVIEKTALVTYIGRYRASAKHPKYWQYNGRLLDMNLK